MRGDRGMTLLETMISIAILTLISGSLFVVASSLDRSRDTQEAKTISQQEAHRAISRITYLLRMAQNSSVGPSTFPSNTIQFQSVQDVDGNGWVVDSSGILELSPVRTITRDDADANGDGITTTQLVMTTAGGGPVEVLANSLAATNGILFERVGSDAIRVTLRCEEPIQPGANSKLVGISLTEIISPRN